MKRILTIPVILMAAVLSGCATSTNGWHEYPMPDGAKYYERDTISMFLGFIPVNVHLEQRGVQFRPSEEITACPQVKYKKH